MTTIQLEESTIRQRLGGRRDSAAQISGTSPPSTSPPPGAQRRRRSSLAQLTDILREWSGGSSKRNTKPPLNRRETLADLARSLPWAKATTDMSAQYTTPQICAPPLRKRRESSADSGIRSMRSRRDSHASELAKLWSTKRENSGEKDRERDRDRDRERDRDRGRDRDRERERDRDREGDENVPPNENNRNVC